MLGMTRPGGPPRSETRCRELRINCGHGVTEIVNVAPNSTLGEVLGEVCTRRKLEPSGHALRHTLGGKKDNLDGSLSFRLSGLSNNAKLELVAAANRLAAPGECTMGLQLEDGSRCRARRPRWTRPAASRR